MSPSPFITCRVSQLAHGLGVTPDLVYSWIRRGLLPDNCVVRDAGSIFIVGEKFREFLASGGLERTYTLRRSMSSLGVSLNMLEIKKQSRPGIQ